MKPSTPLFKFRLPFISIFVLTLSVIFSLGHLSSPMNVLAADKKEKIKKIKKIKEPDLTNEFSYKVETQIEDHQREIASEKQQPNGKYQKDEKIRKWQYPKEDLSGKNSNDE